MGEGDVALVVTTSSSEIGLFLRIVSPCSLIQHESSCANSSSAANGREELNGPCMCCRADGAMGETIDSMPVRTLGDRKPHDEDSS